jgi:hypothetical protein
MNTIFHTVSQKREKISTVFVKPLLIGDKQFLY